MKKMIALIALTGLFTGCTITEDEVDVAIENVPPEILDAVRAELPDLVIESAEIETEDGEQIYEIEGTIDGEGVEVDIAMDGDILEIEREG
ncbi:MAG: PepSY domain-containing protein [Pseudomonadota bacterium]